MTVVFIPFSTALMAEHLKSGADEKVAAVVYSAAFLAMGIAFGLFWTYITKHRRELGVELTDEEVRRMTVGVHDREPVLRGRGRRVLHQPGGGAGDHRPRSPSTTWSRECGALTCEAT